MFTDKYKNTLERYEEFWERKNTDRPILNLAYRKEGYTAFPKPTFHGQKYLDINYGYNAYKHMIANTGYLAEGIPMRFTNFGPGCLAETLGSGYRLTGPSIWFDVNTPVKSMEDLPEIEFNPNSELWTIIENAQRLYASDPDVHFSITDIGGILDVVASLCGTENLLYDLYDYPDEVKKLTAMVKKEWFKAFDRQLKIVRDANQPINNWLNIPSKKPWYPLQCDFCYMISPAQFEEFVLDDIIDQVNYMERSIYHLDGVGELPHIDMLLDIEGLTGIQWVAGAGKEPLYDPKWFDLYKKIQDKNKNLVLLNAINANDLASAERLIKSIDRKGVYISLTCSSKDKAEEMLEKITRWSE